MDRILLFGDKVIGPFKAGEIAHSSVEIELATYPSGDHPLTDRLAEYSVVFLDYSAFKDSNSGNIDRQAIFDKQISEALNQGRTICFLYCDENVPDGSKYTPDEGYMDIESLRAWTAAQIGLRWLRRCGNFAVRRYASTITDSKIDRAEFAPYLTKWGATRNYFEIYGEAQIADLISGANKYAIGFVCNVFKGQIIWLPCQRDYTNRKDLSACIHSLIDCTLTYIAKRRRDLPTWANTPFFKEEEPLASKRGDLINELAKLDAELSAFSAAKNLLFCSEHDFEAEIETFFRSQLGFSTQKIERFAEDFLLIDDKKNVVAICEAKSTVKGFKKSGVYAVYNHRETNGFPDTLPGIVIVNQHLQATSWSSKDRPIDKQDYQVAANNNVLILRTEDVVRLWRLLELHQIDKTELARLVTSSKGWLEISRDLITTCRN